ncbi:hypothetical protein F5Y08DRAFT_337112 [Xylaria arbuscula]|nr:hypothetical protein F5Y08DRAFT_337112 [Xylaria arbuscula]
MALGPTVIEPSTTKRSIEQDRDRDTPASAKKRRLSGPRTETLSPPNEKPLQTETNDAPRPRSTSPEDSSLFDNSTIENSQVTVISEPDIEATVTPARPTTTENRPRQGSMTREEARQKAEILRLRLGLASYKVKTNQTDVPLERLQVRPVPGRVTKAKKAPVSALSSSLQATSQQCLAALSRRNEEQQRLSSPARIERAASWTVAPSAQSHNRNGSGSSILSAKTSGSPTRTQESEQRLPPEVLNTPQQRLPGRDAKLTNSEQGDAAEGLLSLSQSSPASILDIRGTPK